MTQHGGQKKEERHEPRPREPIRKDGGDRYTKKEPPRPQPKQPPREKKK